MTEYSLSLAPATSICTGMISDLLDESHKSWLLNVRPADVTRVFGPGDYSGMICRSKGYTDPDWYWQASDGNVWGIGWRWGTTRLRGKGYTDKCTAYEFVEFLKNQLECK